MRNLIRNISNSSVCEISILVIISCLISFNLSIDYNGKWNTIAVISVISGAVVLFGLLTWATVMLITGKEVREMSLKPRIIIETVSSLLFLNWLYIAAGAIAAIIWGMFVVWDVIRNIRQIHHHYAS